MESGAKDIVAPSREKISGVDHNRTFLEDCKDHILREDFRRRTIGVAAWKSLVCGFWTSRPPTES